MHIPLDDDERDQLTAPCDYWANRLTDDQVLVIASGILDAFDAWKSRLVDEQGFLRTAPGINLLSLQDTALEIAEAKPWQCAGPFVRNEIDLALSLWRDEDPHLNALIDEHGLGETFSVVGLWSKPTAAFESLICLNQLLVIVLSETLNAIDAGRKASLANARVVASETRKNWGAANRTRVRMYACEYLTLHPLASNAEVVAYVKTKHPNPATSTIQRMIAGCRTEVKNSLKLAQGQNNDLYATPRRKTP